MFHHVSYLSTLLTCLFNHLRFLFITINKKRIIIKEVDKGEGVVTTCTKKNCEMVYDHVNDN